MGDPETGEEDPEGYPDKYELEEIELGFADYVTPVTRPNFAQAWQALEDKGGESEDVFELTSMTNLQEAVDQVLKLLGLSACERSSTVKEGKNRHELFMAGMYVGGQEVLARARLAFDEHVSMNLCVRAPSEELSQLVLSCIE